MLGFKGNLKWTQADDALEIEVPPQKPCDYAVTFKIVGARPAGVAAMRSARATMAPAPPAISASSRPLQVVGNVLPGKRPNLPRMGRGTDPCGIRRSHGSGGESRAGRRWRLEGKGAACGAKSKRSEGMYDVYCTVLGSPKWSIGLCLYG